MWLTQTSSEHHSRREIFTPRIDILIRERRKKLLFGVDKQISPCVLARFGGMRFPGVSNAHLGRSENHKSKILATLEQFEDNGQSCLSALSQLAKLFGSYW
jgi:hypothetical protein